MLKKIYEDYVHSAAFTLNYGRLILDVFELFFFSFGICKTIERIRIQNDSSRREGTCVCTREEDLNGTAQQSNIQHTNRL